MVFNGARAVLVVLISLAVVSCGQDTGADPDAAATDSPTAPASAAAAAWPASLTVVGDGYPRAGDACRVIGESAATVDFLDDSATLVGCRDKADAARLGGRVLTVVDGVTLVSVPRTTGGDGDGQGDSKVAGTDYHATSQIRCSGMRGASPGMCDAGVKRRVGDDGGSLIEVSWPGGGRRTLFFDAKGAFLSADGNQADGSAAYTAKVSRREDIQIIRFGPEQYEVPDVFLLGD